MGRCPKKASKRTRKYAPKNMQAAPTKAARRLWEKTSIMVSAQAAPKAVIGLQRAVGAKRASPLQ